jgi:hypothetical protein
MKQTASGYVSESTLEATNLTLAAEMKASKIDLTRHVDGFENIRVAYRSLDRLGWKAFWINSTGQKASLATPYEDYILAVEANGLCLISCAVEKLPYVTAKPGFEKAPIFTDGKTATFLFKGVGDFEGRSGELTIRSWASVVRGFENFLRCYLRIAPSLSEHGDQLTWIRRPKLRSLLPKAPSLKLEASA